MFRLLLVSCLIASAISRPQQPEPVAQHAAAAAAGGPTPIPIVSQTEEINPDGSFKFSYETGNGIKFEESGYQKDSSSTDKILVIQGSVSYTDQDGKVINLKYIADENGFQPEGDHIPTSPPAPEAIAKSLKELPAGPQEPASSVAAQPAGTAEPAGAAPQAAATESEPVGS